MARRVEADEEIGSENNSTNSIVSPLHSSPYMSLPLAERMEVDREWYYLQSGHFYEESKKNWHLQK